ncbi:hypothetical protein L195_g053285 [Trifolium pratense]|uniref:Uncharacterized protein n=1 Tax=Trifolium pratense TaxID=57577 RepID=A0A2K3K9Q3_TRIPR|nr:hypothetical protein L195_g053285 [Trifolium pratense]
MQICSINKLNRIRQRIQKLLHKDKKYRFSVISYANLLNNVLNEALCDLHEIHLKLPIIQKNILTKPAQDMMTDQLNNIIQRVRMSFYGISSSSIDCVEDDDFVTKEDNDSVFERKDKLKDDAFIRRGK